MASSSERRSWVGLVISVLPCLLFLVSAFFKVKGGPSVSEGFAHLGLSDALRIPLAILELSCVALYLIPVTSVLGAILLTGFLGGAILAHLRAGDPFYVQILLGILIWLGIWLREPRLRDILPLRRR